MAKVTQLHRHPEEHNDLWEEEIFEWISDITEFIKNRAYGRITAGAIVLVNDKLDVVTAYAGKVRTFTMVGAFKHMGNRIFNENMQDENED